MRVWASGQAYVASRYSLTASHNDYVHALVTYFDVGFTRGSYPVWFTTRLRPHPPIPLRAPGTQHAAPTANTPPSMRVTRIP